MINIIKVLIMIGFLLIPCSLFSSGSKDLVRRAEDAWEKAVILSPRPEFINAMLISALSRKFKNIELSDIRNRVENRIFFAKKIRVKRRVIEFFVPAKVLGDKCCAAG